MIASSLAFPLLVSLLAGAPPEANEPAVPAPEGVADEAAVPAPDDVIVPPALLERPALVNPLPDEEARALGAAVVVLLVTVDTGGRVADAAVVEEASHPDERLRKAALAAAKQARFEPATRGGQPLTVSLPFELTFEPPPLPVVDGVGIATRPLPPLGAQLDEEAVVDVAALGRSLVVGGALVLGAGLLFTTFSGVTALDDAARQEELAKTSAETAAAEATRAFGTALLVPFAGPFLALPSTPDASTALFTSLGGAAQLAGAALVVVGSGLWLWPLFAGAPSDSVAEALPADAAGAE